MLGTNVQSTFSFFISIYTNCGIQVTSGLHYCKSVAGLVVSAANKFISADFG